MSQCHFYATSLQSTWDTGRPGKGHTGGFCVSQGAYPYLLSPKCYVGVWPPSAKRKQMSWSSGSCCHSFSASVDSPMRLSHWAGRVRSKFMRGRERFALKIDKAWKGEAHG